MNDDRVVIEAVKQGHRDRFEELVERHKRMVYAIVWSHLGNADICEDAAQETFIKAFRYLGALRDVEKFPAWLSRIARNVSLTILRKRKKELENLNRWRVEQPAPAEEQISNSDESLKEMLGRTLSELAPQHRECLVLFYLEGKSVSETALALGLSEEAVKTRLHRARKALRGKLEGEIERELDGLSPRKNFVASVMLVLPGNTIGTAGIGGGVSLIGKVAAGLNSLLAHALFGLWMTLGQTTFFYLFMRWFAWMETANLIDKPENDFRKVILRRNVMTITLVALCVFAYTFFAIRVFGYSVFYQLLAIYCAWGFYRSLLVLRVNRSAFILGQTLAIFTFLLASVLMGFFGAPPLLFFLALALLNLALAFTNRKAPRRHDYNLFLRQAQGHRGEPDTELHPPRVATRPELRAFARFLGKQWLVRGYSVKGTVLVLRLPPVRATLLNSFLMTTVGDSIIRIEEGRTCRAYLSRSDAESIEKLAGRSVDVDGVSRGVENVIQNAMTHFLQGENAEAGKLLSRIDDASIFTTEFSKTRGYRTQIGISIVAAILLVLLSLFTGAWRWGATDWFGGWGGSPVSQAMARQAMEDWIVGDRPGARANLLMLWGGPANPSLEFLDAQTEEEYKRLVMEDLRMGFDDHEEGAVDSRIINGLLRPNLLYHEVTTPILTPDELTSLGFTSTRVRQTLEGLNEKMRREMLDLRVTTYQRIVDLQATTYRALDIETFAMRLNLLQLFGCLDFVDRDSVAREIAACQVTSQFILPEGYILIDNLMAKGLFHTGRCGLAETQAALSALKTLGRMDLIDREACVEGILRFYRGKGDFKVNNPLASGVTIGGKDEDAFYAMESLALLDALKRIDDFQKWKFHPLTQTITEGNRTSPGHVTANALLSWAYQERLERLRDSIEEN